jgi:hypothetical protein
MFHRNQNRHVNFRIRVFLLLAIMACTLADSRALDIGPMTWTPRADWINVKSCKAVTGGPDAVGDGVADDTAALQAVMTLVQNRSGRTTVYFPPGTYKITDTLKFHDVNSTSILGCGSQTIISWAGASGGAMFLPSATHHMIYMGLTWEGNNLASCAYEHASQATYETVIHHENESFRNFTAKATYSFLDPKGNTVTQPVPPTAAILTGFPTTSGGGLTGETMVYNCKFSNCTNGIVQAWDVGNNFMWHVDSCEFDGCDYGINFFMSGCNDVDSCHFEGSKVADVMGGHEMHVRHCTSHGSHYFYSSFANCPLSADILEDCQVDSWTDPKGAVQLGIPGPNVVFDCVFTHPPANAQPPIHLTPLTNLPPQLLISNNVQPGLAADALVNKIASNVISIPPGKRGGSLTSARQTFLQTSYPAESANVIDVSKAPYSTDGTFSKDAAPAIQAAIVAAQAAHNDSIVYIPNGIYKIGSSLNVSGGGYSIAGEGFGTQLCWIGPKDGAIISVTNPRKMTIKLLRFSVPGGQNVASIRETATKSNSIVIDEITTSGFNPGNPGASGDANDEPGLVFDHLPAGSKVYLPHVDSPITAKDSGAAQIFSKYLAIGEIHVSGTVPDTGYLGACVLEGGQQRGDGWNVVVDDNQSLSIGDFYSEQSGNNLSVKRGAGEGEGHVSFQGFLSASGNNNGSGTSTTTIDVENYKGRVFYGSSCFANYNGSLPVQIRQTGTNPVDLVLVANTYSHGNPNIQTEAGATVTGALNVLDSPYPGVALPDVPNPLTPAGQLAVARGLDDMRKLEAVDLAVQFGISTQRP